jgi:lipopolysaccharide cholinephosphotransferase
MVTNFDNEALRAKYNPEGSQLRRDQMELLRMLRVVTDICDAHGIQWWLSSGTLLGAARHEGFIPWDDDLDIVLLKKDCRRLERLLERLDNEEYVYHSMRTDVDYVNTFGKFRRREGRITTTNPTTKRRCDYYKWGGIGFDIFAIEKTNYFAARAAAVIYNNLQHTTSYIRRGCIRKPLIRFVQGFCFGIVNPILRLVGLINPRKEYHYTLGTGWARHTFFIEDALPLTTARFEGMKLPVPRDVDAYLTNVYGDWRKLPTDEQIRKCIHCKEYIEEIYGKDDK